MSSDIVYATTGTTHFLVSASELRHTNLCGHSIDICFNIPAHKKVNEEAPKKESLIGAEAKVVSRLKPGDHAQYLVRSQGELWSAKSPNVLHPGETVNIGAIDGITLIVKRIHPYQKRASVAGTN